MVVRQKNSFKEEIEVNEIMCTKYVKEIYGIWLKVAAGPDNELFKSF